MMRNDEERNRRLDKVLLQGEVEDFLYQEAKLLDDWRLQEWFDLFTPDGTYQVPPTTASPMLTPGSGLFLIADDHKRLQSRVRQLLSGSAWAETPPSKTRHYVTNVRILGEEEGGIRTESNFQLYKSRHGDFKLFAGEYRHRLVRQGGTFRIAERVALLAQDNFSQGHLAFIL